MYKNFINYFLAALVLVGLYFFMTLPTSCSLNDEDVDDEEIVDSVEPFDNVARADALSEDIFSFICLVEGGILNENTGENYNCGARWTTWYGVTTTPEGKLLKKGQVISKSQAKEIVSGMSNNKKAIVRGILQELAMSDCEFDKSEAEFIEKLCL